MNRVALALALSAVSAASGAAVAKLDAEIYVQPAAVDVDSVGVDPNGQCPAATDAGPVPSIEGGRLGTCFETHAAVSIPSARSSIPALSVQHRSTTNPLAEEALRALIAGVVLPRLAALEPVASNPDVWAAPTLADVTGITVHRPAGKEPRLYVTAVARSLRAGVPDMPLSDSREPEKAALATLVPLLDTFVLPAVRAEVFP